ncbi:MAG TPA: hypothetical protein DEQ61_02650, partial [Streptomyces sp.]|nr:hypothetical protein [Streptomyces sp.]
MILLIAPVLAGCVSVSEKSDGSSPAQGQKRSSTAVPGPAEPKMLEPPSRREDLATAVTAPGAEQSPRAVRTTPGARSRSAAPPPDAAAP